MGYEWGGSSIQPMWKSLQLTRSLMPHCPRRHPQYSRLPLTNSLTLGNFALMHDFILLFCKLSFWQGYSTTRCAWMLFIPESQFQFVHVPGNVSETLKSWWSNYRPDISMGLGCSSVNDVITLPRWGLGIHMVFPALPLTTDCATLTPESWEVSGKDSTSLAFHVTKTLCL